MNRVTKIDYPGDLGDEEFGEEIPIMHCKKLLVCIILMLLAIAYCMSRVITDESDMHLGKKLNNLPVMKSQKHISVKIGGKEVVLPSEQSVRVRVLPSSKKNPQIVRPIVMVTFDDMSWFTVSAIKNSGIESLIHQLKATTRSVHSGKFATRNPNNLSADSIYLKLSTASMAQRTKTIDYFFVVKDGVLITINRHSDMYDRFALETHSLKHKADRIIIHTYIEKPGYNMSSANDASSNRIVYMNIYRPLSNGWTLYYYYVGHTSKWEKQKGVVEWYAKNTTIR